MSRNFFWDSNPQFSQRRENLPLTLGKMRECANVEELLCFERSPQPPSIIAGAWHGSARAELRKRAHRRLQSADRFNTDVLDLPPRASDRFGRPGRPVEVIVARVVVLNVGAATSASRGETSVRDKSPIIAASRSRSIPNTSWWLPEPPPPRKPGKNRRRARCYPRVE